MFLRCTVFLIFCNIFPFKVALSQQQRSVITLQPGEMRVLEFPGAEFLEVSDPKILDIVRINDESNKFQVVALRSGVSAIVWYNRNTGQENRRYVRVSSRVVGLQKSQDYLRRFCQEQPTISCSSDFRMLWGSLKHWQDFGRLVQLCRKHDGCRHQVELAQEGVNELLIHLQTKLGNEFPVRLVGNYPVIYVPCGQEEQKLSMWKKHINLALAGSGAQELITIQCARSRVSELVVWAKVFIIRENNHETLGENLNIQDLGHPKKFGLLNNFQDHLKQAHMQLLAAPRGLAINGAWLHFSSGGSFRMEVPGERVVEVWKEFGFDLKMKVIELVYDRALIELKLRVSAPSSHQEIKSSQLNQQIRIMLNHPTLVAVLDLDENLQQKQTAHFWEKIPIIAPWLQLKSKQQFKSYLACWLFVKPQDNEKTQFSHSPFSPKNHRETE